MILTKIFSTQVAEVDQLKTKIKQYSDYDEIKRELDIMKVCRSCFDHAYTRLMCFQYVEFAGLEGDDDIEDDLDLNGDALGLHLPSPNPNTQKFNTQQGKSLEVLLATKNKRILEELTKFRVRCLNPCFPFCFLLNLTLTDIARRAGDCVTIGAIPAGGDRTGTREATHAQ